MNQIEKNEKNAFIITIVAITFFILTRLFRNQITYIYHDSYFLLFHLLFELFCAFASYYIFLQGWVKWFSSRVNFNLIFLTVGTLNLLDALTFVGMPFILSDPTSSFSTWFGLLSRVVLSLGLLSCALQNKVINLKTSQKYLRLSFTLFIIATSVSIIFTTAPKFPLIINGIGMTMFTISIEYLIIGVHIVTLILILKRYLTTLSHYNLLLFVAIGFLLISELLFTLFHHLYDIDYFFAHVFKTGAYFFILRAAVLQDDKGSANEKVNAETNWRVDDQLLEKQKKMASTIVIQTLEEERKRVSRELHDGIGQSLYSILITLKTLVKTKTDPELHSDIKNIEKIVSNTMSDVKNIAYNLRPSALDDLGLISAIRSHVGKYEETFNIKVHFQLNGKPKRFSPEIEISLYRIFQEALNNAAKYANTSVIHTSLSINETSISLKIIDEGIGFNVNEYLESTEEKGIGLFSMKERTHLVNGTIEIDSAIGQGTTISVVIPIQTSEEMELMGASKSVIINK